MVGTDVELKIHKDPAKPKAVVLSVQDLVTYNEAGKKTLGGVSFTVREGEIVGYVALRATVTCHYKYDNRLWSGRFW